MEREIVDSIFLDIRESMAGLFGLPPEELARLATFLATHAAIDMTLIVLGAAEQLKSLGHPPTDDEAEEAIDRCAEGTFGRHLNAVKAVLSERSAATAEEFNRVRNAFLHWRRESGDRRYRGHDIWSLKGVRAWLRDFGALFHDPAIVRLFGPPPSLGKIILSQGDVTSEPEGETNNGPTR